MFNWRFYIQMTRNIGCNCTNSRQRGLLVVNKQEIFERNSCLLTEVLESHFGPFHAMIRLVTRNLWCSIKLLSVTEFIVSGELTCWRERCLLNIGFSLAWFQLLWKNNAFSRLPCLNFPIWKFCIRITGTINHTELGQWGLSAPNKKEIFTLTPVSTPLHSHN